MDQTQLMQAPTSTNWSVSSAPTPSSGSSGLPGWLERNAQTIGSIALPTIADLVTGGAAAPLDPELAAIGGGGGQEIKNLTTGTNTNPLTEGLISGALTYGGGLLGKGFKNVAGKVGNVADRYGTSLLSQVGGTVDKGTARSLSVPATTKFMSDLGINPSDYGPTSQKFMDLINPLASKGLESASPVDTSGLHDMVDSLVNNETNIGGMATDKGTAGFKLASSLKNDLTKLQGIPNPEGEALTTSGTTNALDKNGNVIGKNYINPNNPNINSGDVLAPNVSPTSVDSYINKLNKDVATTAKQYKGTANGIPTDVQAANNIKSALAKELDQRLNTVGDIPQPNGSIIKGAGADNAIMKGLIDPTTLQSLKSILPDTPLSNRFITAIQNADTRGELRSAMSPFVNASKIAETKAAQMGTSGATNKSIAKVGIGSLAGLGGILGMGATGGASAVIPAAELALSTDTGKTVVGNALRGQNFLGKIFRSAPDTSGSIPVGRNMLIPVESKTAPTILDNIKNFTKNATTKTLTQTLPRTAAAIMQTAKSPNSNTAANTVPTIVDTAVNEALNSMPSTSQVTNANNGVLSASNFQQLESQYGNSGVSAYLNYLKTTSPELSAIQQESWVMGQTLLSRVKQVAQLYSQSNAGPISGRLSELSGVFGSKSGAAAQTYEVQRNELATTLVRFVNEGGSSRGGSTMTNMLKQQLPTLGDSAATASTKFASLVQLVVNQMQNNLAAPATNTPGQITSFAGANPSGGSAGTPSQASSNILNYLPTSPVTGF